MKKYYPAFLLPLILSHMVAETITVSGKVMDEKKNLLENVNVYTDTKGTTTDKDGLFNLSANKNDFITFSHIGYEKKIINAEEIGKIVENR